MPPRDPASRLGRLTRARTAVRRAVLRRRRPLAAVLAALAVLVVVGSLRPADPPTREVVVAAHDLPAGATLGAGDLTTVAIPPSAVPAGLADHAVGRVLAAPLRAGEPVTDVRLVGQALTAQDDGLVAVPVRLPDGGSVALLTVGDHVDLLATDPQGGATTRVADDVPVLAIPAPGAADASPGLPGRLVVVGAPPDDVDALATASVGAFVTYAWARR